MSKSVLLFSRSHTMLSAGAGWLNGNWLFIRFFEVWNGSDSIIVCL